MASSLRKIESARANGAKSRGPVTSEGKQASSFNAVRHALLASKTVVLTHESSNSNRMDAQDEDLKRKFERVDEPTRLAIAFSAEANDSKALALLLRYDSTHRRTYYKAFQNLLSLQAARPRPTEPRPHRVNEPGSGVLKHEFAKRT